MLQSLIIKLSLHLKIDNKKKTRQGPTAITGNTEHAMIHVPRGRDLEAEINNQDAFMYLLGEHSAILSTFIKIFILSIFECVFIQVLL